MRTQRMVKVSVGSGAGLLASGCRSRRIASVGRSVPSVVFGLVVIYGVLGSDPGAPLFFVGGILNRVLIALAFAWVTITAGRLLRNTGIRAR